MDRSAAWPYLAAGAAPVALAAVAALLLPHVGASYDFTQGGAVTGHIVDRSLTPIPVVQNVPGGVLLLCAYLGLYAVAYVAYERIIRRPAVVPALAAFAAAVLGALAVPFFPTSDPYAYALYGAEAGPMHLDPYVSHALAAGSGPWVDSLARIFPSAGAYVRHANYGPTFLFVYAALAAACAHLPLAAFLVAERVLGAVSVAAAACALAFAERRSTSRARTTAAAAFALHPLVLFELVAFAHGDGLMFAALAWAYVAWKRERFALAGLLCGIAIGTRSIALLAVIAGVVALARERRRVPAISLVSGAALALGALGTLSVLLYGDASLGATPIFNRFSAPAVALAVLAGGMGATGAGVVAEAALGLALAVVLLRRWWLGTSSQAPLFLSLAALAGLPTVYPHYVAWFTSLRGFTADARARAVMRAASLAAPLLYVTHLNVFPPPGPPLMAYALVLAVSWGTVVAALVSGPRTRPLALGRAA